MQMKSELKQTSPLTSSLAGCRDLEVNDVFTVSSSIGVGDSQVSEVDPATGGGDDSGTGEGRAWVPCACAQGGLDLPRGFSYSEVGDVVSLIRTR